MALAPATAMAAAADAAGFTPAMVAAAGMKRNKPIQADASRDGEGELVNTAPSLGTAFTALERAYADTVRLISALPEAGRRMDAADRLAEIAQRHLGTTSRLQHEEALGSHSAHPLDFSALARSQIREAREKLDASPGEFAEMLTKLVGHHVPYEVVKAWERAVGGAPPSDVLLAVQQLLG